jgi:uncharacterized protein (DUF3084 family)
MGSIVLFGIVLLVAGGAIAFLGDWLGTYVGKKRLSVFGLRPRHTAMVYTIVSGSLIAILTLSAVLICDTEARKALTQWQETVAKNRTLTTQNKALIAQNVDELRQTQDAKRETGIAEAQSSKAELSQRAAEINYARAEVRLVQGQNAVAASKLALLASQRHLVAVENDVHAKKADLVVARRAVDAAAERLTATQSQLGVAMVRVADARQVNARLVVERDQLTNDNKVLEAKNKDLAAHSVSSYTIGNVIYQKGDELDRTVIATAQPMTDVRHALDLWLKSVSVVADKHGAGAGGNGREVRVVSPTDANADEDDLLDSLAYNISRQSAVVSSVVVVARVDATQNVLVGEQVKLNLQPYDNLLVYRKGAVVASTTVDGTLSEHDILEHLKDFLHSDIRPVAQSHSIMPTLDPTTREPTWGVMGVDDSIIHQIQAAGSTAHVSAITAEDVYTCGPLRLQLEVNKPEDAAQSDPFQSGSTLAVPTTMDSVELVHPSPMASGSDATVSVDRKPGPATVRPQTTVAAPASITPRKSGLPYSTQ